jgi:hypothetical protein
MNDRPINATTAGRCRTFRTDYATAGHGKTLPKNKALRVVSAISDHLNNPRQLTTTETPA